MIRIKISRLFSANAMYTRNHFKTKKYRQWIKEAGWELVAQRPNRYAGAYNLLIEAGKPDNRRRDADNLLKPVSDLLVAHGVVRDDSDAVQTSARWIDGIDGMVAIVKPVDIPA